MQKHHAAALKKLVTILDGNNIKWALGGSMNLSLQGIDIIPGDIDILTDAKGAIAIDRLLSDFTKREMAYSESKQFRSYFGQYIIDDVKIDVMGEVEIKDIDDNWNRSSFETIDYKFEDKTIRLVNLQSELKAYKLRNKIHVADLITKHLDST